MPRRPSRRRGAALAAVAQLEETEASVKQAEQGRETSERARATAEQARVTAEQQRILAEQTRVTNESARQTAEAGRRAAETKREENTAEAIRNCKSATQEAEDEAARVRTLADNPPKIVEVDGARYWAFWDEETQQYVTSDNRADGVPLYASFYVDPETMDLFAVYPKGYGDGPAFSLENGDLSVTINE